MYSSVGSEDVRVQPQQGKCRVENREVIRIRLTSNDTDEVVALTDNPEVARAVNAALSAVKPKLRLEFIVAFRRAHDANRGVEVCFGERPQ